MNSFAIAGRNIGRGNPVYIVAELSGNHNHEFEQAARMIQAAKDAGADAVKLQTYTPDTMTLNIQSEWFRVGGGTLWDGRTLYDLYGEAFTPWEWHPKLKALAEKIGIQLFSSAFDSSSVAFLENMQVPVHKVASFELVDIPLIKQLARTKKPLILSTGMATLAEIEEAIGAAVDAGATEIALLKCTSAYPAPPEDMNLRTIPNLSDLFGVPVGLSDHTIGNVASVVAVTLGACIVEKHFTLSRGLGGPDAAFSLEPNEFKNLVLAIREAEKALGRVKYGVTQHQLSSKAFRRSLFASKDINAGDAITIDNIRSIRPGYGLHPRYFETLIGRTASCNIPRGTPLAWRHIDEE